MTGRLAPTPSGDLHLGNALAFVAAWCVARQHGGRLLLRIEDLDTTRARAEVEVGQRRDLAWLGLTWDAETPRQSSRSYAEALDALGPHTYRCTCTRAQIREAGGVYPGTCRDAGHTEGAVRLRLPEAPLPFVDRRAGARSVDPAEQGDPVLVRRDGLVGYTLAVVVDDLRDGVDEVVRGADLLDATGVQAHLWHLLGGHEPTWLHTPLLVGPDGRKLGKSHGSLGLAALRAQGWTPGDVLRTLSPWLGQAPTDDLDLLAQRFDPAAFPADRIDVPADLAVSAGSPLPR